MNFASFEFLCFLAVLTALYYLVPGRAQWVVLLCGSLAFYAFAGVTCCLFLAAVIVVSYVTVALMGKRQRACAAWLNANKELPKEQRKAYKNKSKKGNLTIVCIGIAVLVVALVYAKFVSARFGIKVSAGGISLGAYALEIMGISYYTFIAIGYMLDVYREKAPVQRNFAKHALFVGFFPQLVMGPISKYSDVGEQYFAPHAFKGKNLYCGGMRVAWGFFKKLVVADAIAPAVGAIVAQQRGGAYFLLLCLFYSVRIYGDFTGGIDIVLGCAEMLGIKLPENFNRPFSSKSTAEYWRRWHITMGSWFTTYIFYPLSVTKSMQKLSKWSRAHLGTAIGKRLPVYITTIVTWLVTGLWHGIAWNFVVWAMLNCLVLLVSQELDPLYTKFRTKFPKLHASAPYQTFMIVRTFCLMALIRVLDCYMNVPLTFQKFFSVFTTPNWGSLFDGGLTSLGVSASSFAVIGAGILAMWGVSQLGKDRPLREKLWEKPWLGSLALAAVVFAVFVFGSYGLGYDASAFIYGGTFN